MTIMPLASELADRHLSTLLEGKSAADEKFLEQLNASLAVAHFDDVVESNFDKPIIYIVGAPRSGTTLVHQILAVSLPFGYVTNIAARILAQAVRRTSTKSNTAGRSGP